MQPAGTEARKGNRDSQLKLCYSSKKNTTDGFMSPPKVLLVDDVKLFLEMEKGLLAPSNLEIHTAQNGLEALEIARRELPDLIIMDMYMPKMDGVTCCTTIKQDKLLSRIPVIMVTNASLKEDMEACRKAGCDAFLAKPVEGKSFLDAVNSFLPSVERREARVLCRIPLEIDLNGKNFTESSVDISLRGMFIESGAQVPVGSELLIKFVLPENSTPPITARGRIAWINDSISRIRPNRPAGLGVHFIEITGEGLPILRINELKAFIATHKGLC